MIARLTGILVSKQPPFLMLDVHNICYELQAPMCTFYALPDVGKSVTVLTHLVVREDAHLLYAFVDEYDKALFKELLKVNKIGAKIALAVLSSMTTADFHSCIENKDSEILVKVPGIGQKTAERLIVEMQNRLSTEFWSRMESTATGTSAATSPSRLKEQASDALISLGYKPGDIRRIFKTLNVEGKTIEEIIRAALRGDTS